MKNGEITHNGHTPGLPQRDTEIALGAVWQALYRRKWMLLAAVSAFGSIAMLYNLLTTPVYESSLLIKKEKPLDHRFQDELKSIVFLQTLDELETEMEIVTSRTVLEKVVHQLNLYFWIERLALTRQPERELHQALAEYQQNYNQLAGAAIPWIEVSFYEPPPEYPGRDLTLQVTPEEKLALIDSRTRETVFLADDPANAVFDLQHLRFKVRWPNPLPHSEIDLSVRNLEKAIYHLNQQVGVRSIRKTNIFRISAESTSPYMAQLISNTLADMFRETRLEQKRRTIRYSANFVDRQLEEISGRLREAETALSEFKSSQQIVAIDESSRQTLAFLSSLETEKIKTELELAEYQSRYRALQQQLEEKLYFDQTYLTPQEHNLSNSPFSTLLQQLSAAELKRLELLQFRTEHHPDVQAMDERIAKIKENLSGYNRETIAAYRIIMDALLKKREDLAVLIKNYTLKMQRLPEQETRLMELMRKRSVYEKMFVLLLDKQEEMRMAELSNMQDIVIVAPAATPLKPVRPRKALNLMIALVLGTIAGVALAFAAEFRNAGVRNPADLERGYGIPVLAILPKFDKKLMKKIARNFSLESHLVLLQENRNGIKESLRIMRTKLSHLMQGRNVLQFTSCEAGTGKTTVLGSVSLSLALAGKKVLVIDCDLKRPRLGRFFEIPETAPGLIAFLKKEAPFPEIYHPLKELNGQPVRLSIIPAGGSVENSSELLDHRNFRNFLRDVAPFYDFVLIDTPPITKTVDSLVLGRFVKDVLIVIRPDLTHKDRLAWALQDFRQFGVHVVGAVFNGCDMGGLPTRYRNGYGYGYGYQYGVEASKIS